MASAICWVKNVTLVAFIEIDFVGKRFSIHVVEIILYKKFHYITASSSCRNMWCDEDITSSPERWSWRQWLSSKNIQNGMTNPTFLKCFDNVLLTDQISSTDINQNGLLKKLN